MGLKKERDKVKEMVDFFREVGRNPTKFDIQENVKHVGLSPSESDAVYAFYGFEKPRKKHNAIHRVMKAQETPEIAPGRVSEALQYIHSLHDGNDKDALLFALVKHKGEPSQMSFQRSEVNEDFVKRLLSLENVFISVNSYFKRQRTEEAVQRFSAVFLDFDKVKDPEAFLDDLKDSGRLQGIPPSLAVASGNGLHLYWRLDGCYANPKLNRFVERVQEAMLKRFPEADKQVKDAPRVMRLPGSLNMKDRANPKAVRLITLDSEPHYRIDELGRELLPSITEKATAFPEKPKAKKKLKITASNLVPFQKNIQSLHYARMKDIELYLKHDAPETRRRYALFMYRHFAYRMTGNKENALKLTLELNENLPNPVPTREIVNHTGSAVKDRTKDNYGNQWNGYQYKNETIISELEISPELQKKMSTLISKAEKDARHRTRMNKLREPIKKETTRRKESLVVRAKALKANGLSNPKIASEIGVSVATVKRYLKQNLE